MTGLDRLTLTQAIEIGPQSNYETEMIRLQAYAWAKRSGRTVTTSGEYLMVMRRPAEVFPPGEILRDELEERGWTQTDLAEIIGRPVGLVNEIIKGKRGISPETAREFSAAFGTSPEFWMNLDAIYQLSRINSGVPYYDDGQIQIWLGDCREILPTLSFDAIIADPPYGISFDTDYTRFTGGVAAERRSHPTIHGDKEPFDPAWLLSQSKNVVLFGANCFSDRLPQGSWLIWDKRSPNGHKNVMSDGEAAWWSRGSGVYIYTHTWDGFNRASERNTAYHPTQKPVALMQWVIQKCTRPDDVIVDPYCGSGPVLLAARNLGRRAVGIELRAEYVERSVSRLAQAVLPLEAS